MRGDFHQILSIVFSRLIFSASARRRKEKTAGQAVASQYSHVGRTAEVPESGRRREKILQISASRMARSRAWDDLLPFRGSGDLALKKCQYLTAGNRIPKCAPSNGMLRPREPKVPLENHRSKLRTTSVSHRGSRRATTLTRRKKQFLASPDDR